jgi:hypothetical protein
MEMDARSSPEKTGFSFSSHLMSPFFPQLLHTNVNATDSRRGIGCLRYQLK